MDTVTGEVHRSREDVGRVAETALLEIEAAEVRVGDRVWPESQRILERLLGLIPPVLEVKRFMLQ